MLKRHKPEHLSLRDRTAQWSRRKKLAAGGGVVTAFAVGAVVAWALTMLTADIDGGGQIDAPADTEFTAATVVNGGTANCTPTVASGDLDLQIAGTQNEFCDLDLTVKRVGEPGEAVYVQGLTFADEVTEGYVEVNGVQPCVNNQRVEVTSAGVTVRARFRLTGTPPVVFTAFPDAGMTIRSADAINVDTFGNIIGCPVAT
jgi:hypothetical protein